MAALTAALALSEGNWTERFERITVYQRGWRLGGKGASSRGPHGRIEEHGLHLLLGYYHETFDVMRRCYEELDRSRSDPGCPIRTWDDAVAPSNLVGVTDREGDAWVPWVAAFGQAAGRPGDRTREDASVAELALRSVALLADFVSSLGTPDRLTGRVHLSTSPVASTAGAPTTAAPAELLHGAALAGLALQLAWLRRMSDSRDPSSAELGQALPPIVRSLRDVLHDVVIEDRGARRMYQLVELVTANLTGIVADRLLVEGFGSIDHLDYRDWLLRHGVAPSALDSPLLRGMYDLVFAYEGGDRARPRFSAGLGLRLATQMLLGYSGALFWKMQGGMGEIVFAPIFELLRSRGVEFRFFHRVDALRLSADGRTVAAIELGLQADVDGAAGSYDPLVRVKGLPCWPSTPLRNQLRDPACVDGIDLESFWSPRRDVTDRTLVRGRDFDAVVFGISLGMVPHVCADLVSRSPDWRAMVDNIGTVATQSFQLWLKSGERELGWTGPDAVTVSGFVEPFDTWASMAHLLELEDWPDTDRPATIAYFCGSLAPPDPRAGAEPQELSKGVRERACAFLERDVAALWPGAVDRHGFRWDLLSDGVPATRRDGVGRDRADRLSSQYWRANVDPSDLYVQSLPGTDQYRLHPGSSGFDNLFLAGDWTDCGLNAGCVEAATKSGRLAAEAVVERMPGLVAERTARV